MRRFCTPNFLTAPIFRVIWQMNVLVVLVRTAQRATAAANLRPQTSSGAG
jgi:hypothetical protein